MNGKLATVAAIALGSLVASLAVLLRPAQRIDVSDDLVALRAEIAAVRELVAARSVAPPVVDRPVPAAPTGPTDSVALAALAKRVSAVEEAVNTTVAVLQAGPDTSRRRPDAPRMTPQAHVDILVDAGRDPRERAASAMSLRGSDRHNEPAVADSIVWLLEREPDASVRADIVRNLERPTAPRLVQGLIEILGRDPDAKVREEAAETLGKNREAPGALDALKRAAETDSDARVRKQAEAASKGLDFDARNGR
jgi:HEAT repeat protein